MSNIWQLPEDILRILYSEWLEWKDLAGLDIACVEKSERGEWLTFIADLRMTQRLTTNYIFSNDEMRIFYNWMRSHRVFCVEGSVVMPDVLEDLVGGLLDMESYCPTLRSIDIYTWSDDRSISDDDQSDIDQVKNNLSVFLSYCHNLQEVKVIMDDMDKHPDSFSRIILQVFSEKLRKNSLTKISLEGCDIDKSDDMVANLLIKHASSLQDLNLSHISGVQLIMSTLTERHIRLRVLSVDMGYEPLDDLELYFISYLSSTGDLLEDLKVNCWSLNADELVLSVSTSCPKLIKFYCHGPCTVENLRQFFEHCPCLRHVSIEGTMQTDEDINSVSIEVRGSNYDWVISLSHILKRRLYKQVTLRLYEDYYHPVGNLKSMLEPYQICLKASTSERALISLLQDLPHLNTLHLSLVINNQYADATLSAIAEHANSLTKLSVIPDFRDQLGLSNSDKLLCELIQRCPSLERLSVFSCGLEIIMTALKHSNVTSLYLTIIKEVSEDMLDGLLLDKKAQWPSTLEVGSVESFGSTFSYEFNKDDHHWTKYGRS
eukprot:scaffold10609_cov199-Ochromonas_danica.AAC.2